MRDLDSFPRVQLAHLPTPLEPLERLSEFLGGPPIWIKRDDCTGLATGGNKTRKLEYLMGEALQRGASNVLCFGALQSNHVRQTAAAAAKLGMRCYAILTDVVSYREPAYDNSGNLFLDELLGADVYVVGETAAAAAKAKELVAEFERDATGYYTIPVGGSSAIGALGYVQCAHELVDQAGELGLTIGSVVNAISSAGTQAGLLVGLASVESPIAVQGFNVYRDDPAQQRRELDALCLELTRLLEIPPLAAERIRISDEFMGPGYGVPTPAMLEAVRLVARTEGILLDPVYSGKAMAGLIAQVRRGELTGDAAVVFMHTGGSAGLFAYRDALKERARA